MEISRRTVVLTDEKGGTISEKNLAVNKFVEFNQ
jgi:hypothetical protein